MITSLICVLINLLHNYTIFLCVVSRPYHKGSTLYDKQCVFGNNMDLTEENVSFLLDWCDPDFPPKIKYYVYIMTYSSIMKKSSAKW
jgi:hypothetical protein